ncbi:MAG: M23 family metallopeptidase [Peptococcaceae bacterium]|jgi:murein DD-endopeptidase MepM/ murein hydrolase activator NlpD|nr:M23 family metallopeptidase [Peptococcaceae bacterium]
MNPFERWDEWEWEKAAQELGRNRRYDDYYDDYGSNYRRYYYKGPDSEHILDKWTGSQKRVVLSALLFLTILFSAQGEDFVSRSVYSVYKTGIDSGNLYVALNSMAKEAMGIPVDDSIPVGSPVEEVFYPPVAGVVKVGFEGKNFRGETSRGIEIESTIGTQVLCPAEGVVLDVVRHAELGQIIHLNFGDGWEGIIGNLGEVAVSPGDPVYMGLKLGTVGLTSERRQPWLYFELLKNNRPVNPLLYLIQNK